MASTVIRLTVLSLCARALLLLIISNPHQALGSSRGSFGLTGDITGLPAGLCASAVSIHGYICQEFEVRTDDGYILSLQRIPEGRGGGDGGGNKKQPVLLQHGVLV
ncbi:unnamed protein product, partial [Ilex paraguariensis]